MRNIILFGPARSGKTTLAKRLQEQLGFENASVDYMRCLYYAMYPDEKQPDIKPVMRKIEPMLNWQLERFLDYNQRGKYGIMEGILFEDFLQTIDRDKHFLIGLGFCKITPKQKLEQLLEYETQEDWTINKTMEEKRKACEDGVTFSHEIKKVCEKLNCPYFDTSFDRDKVIDDLMKFIQKITL